MTFLHKREFLDSGDLAVVDCSHQCNVMLLDDNNFQKYKSRRAFRYLGGFFKRLPAQIVANKIGYWNIVLDLGGGSARIKHSIRILKNS